VLLVPLKPKNGLEWGTQRWLPVQEGSGEPQLSPVDGAAVRAQLERILLSAPFRNSKRYPAFLRYVVEQELSGASSDFAQ
jgi:hypothetical protein